MKAALESNIPGLSVTGEATPTSSGAFEVKGRSGKLFHSKLGGDGYLDNDRAKLGLVLSAVKAAKEAGTL